MVVNLGGAKPLIQRAAMRLVGLSSSSSTTERTWSDYDYICTKRRNRLTTQRAEKLVVVYGHYRARRSLRQREVAMKEGRILPRWVATAADWAQVNDGQEADDELDEGGYDTD